MGVRVEQSDASIRVALTGIDRLLYWRAAVEFPIGAVTAVSVAPRSSLETRIDSRLLGRGASNGARRPGGNRIGSMLGREVAGKQCWAVPAGDADQPLLVLDLADHEFARAVLAIAEPDAVAARLTAGIDRP